MSELLTDFERACEAAEVPPAAALQAGGVHKSLWWKWKRGEVSPTLKNFELAREGLKKLKAERGRKRTEARA